MKTREFFESNKELLEALLILRKRDKETLYNLLTHNLINYLYHLETIGKLSSKELPTYKELVRELIIYEIIKKNKLRSIRYLKILNILRYMNIVTYYKLIYNRDITNYFSNIVKTTELEQYKIKDIKYVLEKITSRNKSQ